jgi:hypothetical protein
MVRPKGSRIRHCNDTKDHHGPGHSPFRDCGPKGDVLLGPVDQDMCEASTN